MPINKDFPLSKQVLMYSGALFMLSGAVFMGWLVMDAGWYKGIRAEITNQPYARTITVNAEGKVTAKPDIAIIGLSVVSDGLTVKAVTLDGNQKMDQVIKAVKGLGVESKDIVTSQYNLYPDYKYDKGQVGKIVGYKLNQEITVKVRQLEDVQDVLDSGIKAGANQVGQFSFEIDDASLIKKDARDIAFKTARDKALQMTSSAGVKLGRVVTFSEGDSYSPPRYANFAMDSMKAESSVAPAPSIEPGSKEINLTVSVTYEID